MFIEGRLQSRTWQDNDGNQHRAIEIVANDILLLSDKHNNENDIEDTETDEEYPF